ncbi:MAG: DNA-binding protein [Betaproteobacteria bacterium]|nr:DNA-binding protein [Betaproteobacteria bacterium]MCL2885598.1 DNA-binding protein [Betaproteobacteria bacterium]
MKALLTVEQLSAYIHKSVASIRSDVTRNPASLPPICRLPGTKRLLWRIEDVECWIAQHIHGGPAGPALPAVSDNARPKRGRPTKAEQVARQRQQAKPSGIGHVSASAGA